MTVTCPKCNALCRDDERYCPMCGTQLDTRSAGAGRNEATARTRQRGGAMVSDDDTDFIPLVVSNPPRGRFDRFREIVLADRRGLAVAVLVAAVLAAIGWFVWSTAGDDGGSDEPSSQSQLEAGTDPDGLEIVGTATPAATTSGTPSSPDVSPAATAEAPVTVTPASVERSPTEAAPSPGTPTDAVDDLAAIDSRSTPVLIVPPTQSPTAILIDVDVQDAANLPTASRTHRQPSTERGGAHASGASSTGETALPSSSATAGVSSTPVPEPTTTSSPPVTTPLTPTAEPTAIGSPMPATRTPAPNSVATVAPTLEGLEGADGASVVLGGSTLDALLGFIARTQLEADASATPINGDGTGGVVVSSDELDPILEGTPAGPRRDGV